VIKTRGWKRRPIIGSVNLDATSWICLCAIGSNRNKISLRIQSKCYNDLSCSNVSVRGFNSQLRSSPPIFALCFVLPFVPAGPSIKTIKSALVNNGHKISHVPAHQSFTDLPDIQKLYIRKVPHEKKENDVTSLRVIGIKQIKYNWILLSRRIHYTLIFFEEFTTPFIHLSAWMYKPFYVPFGIVI
jgi:hypothetical protein